MRALLGAGVVLVFLSAAASADSPSLAGSLWQCTRASDKSRFVIRFYPGGGVGGGEMRAGEVSPYIFDASHMKQDEWPGHWEQTADRFSWSFPDQHMEITGTVSRRGPSRSKLTGTETVSGVKSAVTCTVLTRMPRIGKGLVIPKDNHFMDLEKGEGALKVPAGISLNPPAR